MSKEKKVAIIGSGPAGLTAAIYTARANLDTKIFLGLQPGGQLTTTTEVENFPGFPEGIMGPMLMSNMQQQAQRFGAKTELTIVEKIAAHEEGGAKKFSLTLNGGEVEEFDAVIVASGASAKYLGIPGEEKYIGKGYHSCATCDGFFYKGKTIAVVGGGDSAMEESTFLTKFADKVYLIHRREEFRASQIMIDRMRANQKIEVLYNTVITQFEGEPTVQKIHIENLKTGETSTMNIDGVFVAIGHTPNSDFAKGLLSMDDAGYLIPQSRLPREERTSEFSMMSNIEGIFVAGDIEDTVYRQAITAAGDGCRAAIECEKWLEMQ